jgi:hypothetical protein
LHHRDPNGGRRAASRAGLASSHGSVRNVFHAEARRDGRGAETCNGNNKKESGVVDGEERCAGGPMLTRAARLRASPSPAAPPRGITLRTEHEVQIPRLASLARDDRLRSG